MKILRRRKIEDTLELRDLTKPWPDAGFCPLCGKKDEVCKCEKLNCQCGILAINCNWPTCVCSCCLEINYLKCECNKKNEQ